ncbi:MFS transporter [Rhodococcus sp. ARC_M6]|uniref:MFS transporter n=1 Tax=Rhodococcus sp. ARC_M6 TaxID=2928852 RepID=UPI001FB4C824|nr:MFS transporter [Rhodococcus sp. ARC_M6]MCJ0902796.1 MFS transporter [Rhodococcus sp. ARC_M6]
MMFVRSSATEATHDGWTPRLTMSLVSMGLVLEVISISSYMTATALKPIGEYFKTDQIAWVMTAWLLMAAIACPIVGKLADVYGKRRMFLISLAIATVGALISATATSFGLFIVGRALFGCLITCMFLAYSLMRDIFPPKILALAVSITAAGMGLMSIPSPFLTGILLATWSFRSIFWFFAISLVILAPVVVLTTRESPVRTASRVDLIGAALLGGGLAAVLVGVSFGPTWGWANSSTLLFLVGGVGLLAAWLTSSFRIPEPLIDLRFFRRGPMLKITTAAGFSYGTITLYTTMLPLMCMAPATLALGYGFGIDAKQFAILQAPIGIGSVIGGLSAGRAIRHIKPTVTLIVGLGLMTTSSVLTAALHADRTALLVWVLLFGIGMGAATASIPNLVIASVPAAVQATMSSMVQTAQTLIASIFPVVAFAMLSAHVATVVDGYTYYTDGGMARAYVLCAASSVAAIVVASLLLHRRRHAPRIPPEDSELARSARF